MSMKRFLCILISICFICAAYAATAENENKKITFTVTDEGDKICLATSLLPEQKTTIYQAENGETGDLFALIQPELLPRLLLCFRDAVLEMNREGANREEGTFAGDLFDRAKTKDEIEVTGADLCTLISAATDRCRQNPENETTESTMTPETAKRMEQMICSAAGKIFDLNIKARISTYDQKYMLISVLRNGEVLLTLSADLSEKDTFRLLLARRVAGSVFYEEITCAEGPEAIVYISSLYRSEASSFRMVQEQECVQFAEIRFMDIAGDNYAFEGELLSALFDSTMAIKGKRTTGENGRGTISTDLIPEGEGTDPAEILIQVFINLMKPGE